MHIDLLRLISILVEEASLPLCEEMASLKLLLACIGDSLEQKKACTSGGLKIDVV
jgi:hypothetical protein